MFWDLLTHISHMIAEVLCGFISFSHYLCIEAITIVAKDVSLIKKILLHIYQNFVILQRKFYEKLFCKLFHQIKPNVRTSLW